MPPTRLELSKLDYDAKYYPRVNGREDWITVLRYRETLEENPDYEFDPITVVRATGYKRPFMLIDGLHRTKAYVQAGRTEIPAVIERLPQSKWMARSVELNSRHGRPLDAGDRAWVSTRLLEEGWDIGQVANLLRMKVASLEKIMYRRAVRITEKDAEDIPFGRANRIVESGHVGFLKAPLTEANGTPGVLEALKSQFSVTNYDVIGVLDSFLAVLRSGVIDMTDEAIEGKVREIKRLVRKL